MDSPAQGAKSDGWTDLKGLQMLMSRECREPETRKKKLGRNVHVQSVRKQN